MADLLIKGMGMPSGCINPQNGNACPIILYCICGSTHPLVGERGADCPLVEVPTHGRLIDAGELRAAMYHNAFEKDSDMQRWDSGCWIRYKMFEKVIEAAPTVIEASEDGEQDG